MSKTQWPEIYCFHGHFTAATAVVCPITFGERKTSVLCAFDPAQFLSLIHLLCCWDEECLPCQNLVLVSLKPSALWEALFRWVTKRWFRGRHLSAVRAKDLTKLVPCIPPPPSWSLPHSWGFAVIATYLCCFLSLLVGLMGHIWSLLSLPAV